MEILKQHVGIDLTHVPYRGGGPAGIALLAGDISAMFGAGSIVPVIQSGKARVCRDRRQALLADAGAADRQRGLSRLRGADLARPVRAGRGAGADHAALRAEVTEVLKEPDVIKRLGELGLGRALLHHAEEFPPYRGDNEKTRKVIRSIGAKLDDGSARKREHAGHATVAHLNDRRTSPMQEKSQHRRPPADPGVRVTEFLNLHEFVAKARQNLSQNHWDYIVRAETETTLRRNRMALDAIAFRPRVLTDVSKVDASVERFGRKMRLPVMLAPVGSLESFIRARRERSCAPPGVRHRPHDVVGHRARARGSRAGGARCAALFQLYVRGDEAFVNDHVERAIKNGFSAFCFTVDTAHYSRRERDLAKRYQTAGRRRVAGRKFQMELDWKGIDRIKQQYKIPLIIKGIATGEDAKIAVDHGVEWIYISNHGGRQLDHGRGSMDVLPEVVDAVAGRAKIMIDGGFYRGSDIVKAIALGADLVGMGRMQCYALAAGGAAGVVRMLEILEDEVQRSLGLLGVNTFADLNTKYLHMNAPVVTVPSVFSAFPLLTVDPWRY